MNKIKLTLLALIVAPLFLTGCAIDGGYYPDPCDGITCAPLPPYPGYPGYPYPGYPGYPYPPPYFPGRPGHDVYIHGGGYRGGGNYHPVGGYHPGAGSGSGRRH